MTTEFNLSDKIRRWSRYFVDGNYLDVKDVKEFIRLLKDEIDSQALDKTDLKVVKFIIDKLAGEKLIK